MMQKRFKDLCLVHLICKGSELFETITVKMRPQTESCFTRTILIENENSVKNIFFWTKWTTEHKTRKLLVVAQAIERQKLGSLMKWKMSERKWLCRIRYEYTVTSAAVVLNDSFFVLLTDTLWGRELWSVLTLLQNLSMYLLPPIHLW